MTQTLRRERRQKFTTILSRFSDKLSQAEIEATADLLADASVSESERHTDETFGEYHISPIYKIYEENIGVITPMLAEQLKGIESDYPEGWFEDAVKEALKNNVRKLTYIVTIMDRWKVSGRNQSRAQTVKREEGQSSGYFA